MLKYTKYLLSSMSRKKAPYIIIISFFFLFNLTTFLLTREMNKVARPYINSLSTFDKFFPFLFSALFIAMIVIYTFKQGESDGSELIVVAKPLSRPQIIFGKFIALYIYLIAWTLLSFLNYLAISFIDKVASMDDKISFATSLSFGGFIILIILSSMLVIMAAFVGRTTLLSSGIILSAIVPILSFMMVPIAKGQPYGFKFLNSPVHTIKQNKLGTNNDLKNIDFSEMGSVYDSPTIYLDNKIHYDDSYADYQSKQWYGKFAYGDLWYQWGRFYSLFQSQTISSGQTGNWGKGIQTVKANDEDTIKIGSEKYVLYSLSSRAILNKPINELISVVSTQIIKNKTKFEALSLYGRISAIGHTAKDYINGVIDINGVSTKTTPDNWFVESNKDSFNPSISIYGDFSTLAYSMLLKSNVSPAPGVQFKLAPATSAYPSYVNFGVDSSGATTWTTTINGVSKPPKLLNSNIFNKVGSKIYIYKGREFISTNHVLIVWTLLALLSLCGSFLSFIKRDFK